MKLLLQWPPPIGVISAALILGEPLGLRARR
jgi:hypothetical protein